MDKFQAPRDPLYHVTHKTLYFCFSGNIVDICAFLLHCFAMDLDYDSAAELLSQLGYVTRLKIVRELVRAGFCGMPVGNIQQKLGIPNSTLSHHLSHLKQVGLIRQEREGTVLRCFVDFNKISDIVRFLTEECCAADTSRILGKPA